jgi:hypothetical protein
VKTLSGLYRFVQFPWTQMLPTYSLRTSFLRPSCVKATHTHTQQEHGNSRNRRSCVFCYLSAGCSIEVSHLSTLIGSTRYFPRTRPSVPCCSQLLRYTFHSRTSIHELRVCLSETRNHTLSHMR